MGEEHGGMSQLDDPGALFFVAPPPPCPVVVPSGVPVFSGTAAGLGLTHGGCGVGGAQLLPPLEPPLAGPPPPQPGRAAKAAQRQPKQEPEEEEGPQGAGDKAALAREKNRLAQRRFREKERQRLAQVQSQAEGLEAKMAALRLENARLAHWQRLLEKTLAVRNALLAVTQRLEPEAAAAAAGWGSGGGGGAPPPGRPGLLDDAALRAASASLAAALGELPSADAMQRLADELAPGGEPGPPPPQQQLWPAGGPAASPSDSSGGSSGSGGEAAAGGSAAAAASGAAAAAAGAEAAAVAGGAGSLGAVVAAAERGGVDGARVAAELRQLGVPPPDEPALRARVQEMQGVGEMVAAWREHRAGIAAAYSAAAAAGWERGGAAAGALEARIQALAQLFWYAAQLRPKVFNAFILAALPPPSPELERRVAEVAARSLAMLSESEVLTLRQAWQRYMRRAAVAAVAARPQAAKLAQLLQLPGSEALAAAADRHLKVAEVASRLAAASEEQYKAVMAFLREIGTAVNTPVRCYWQLALDEYLPDHPAIVAEILAQHQRRLAGGGGAPPPPGRALRAPPQAPAQPLRA